MKENENILCPRFNSLQENCMHVIQQITNQVPRGISWSYGQLQPNWKNLVQILLVRTILDVKY